jgi:hypothetical protein
MTITLNSDYDVALSTALLGYVGETNARPVSVEGMEIDGADRYILTIDYGDGVQYEVDITGGQWTPTADILRSAQTVSCQIAAKKLSGDEYVLVKKSRIFRLRIGAAIGDTAVPSPDVAKDALDRIDAIGRQAHADMQTAVTAADTATTMANNAAKSDTSAEKSADTAEQAASRAETAKASAETSATQADTARQGAENARQQAVTSQNNAKISAAQAATSAQQTEADKTITTGYAKTAKTCADSTTADRQAVQEMAEQVTVDKATVADHAAQVAEDRTAAETAAQTAQAVADSLPDDYVTAVGKIAENTAEIGRVKLTDKELTRRVNALYSIGNGITHQFETDSETAYVKTIPTGAKLMSVKSVGGRSITFNQMYKKFDYVSGGILNCKPIFKSHKYLLRVDYSVSENTKVYLYFRDAKYTAETNRQIVKNVAAGSGKISWITSPLGEHSDGGDFGVFRMVTDSDGSQKLDTSPFSNHEIFDLTTMFGSRNEPSTVEDFLKFFPADYYPYNAGEIISAGTEDVVEQGKNLWDEVWGVGSINASSGNDEGSKEAIYSKNYTPIIPNSTYIFVYAGSAKIENVKTRFYDHNKKYIGYNDNNGQIVYPNKAFITPLNAFYVRFTMPPMYGDVYKNDIALIAGSSGTYAPFHRNEYHIPDAIKALPGYGIEGNVTNYETKTYTQNNTVDGTEVKALDTPIITDISSLIPDDFLRNLTVEAGGSVTFKNSNGDNYRIPVPSEEEYIVKLSEVGGTT